MRIIAGKYKGRPLIAPTTDKTRPTSDRARESVFNILTHAPWAPELDGARILDLFAGSGALGFEALSRGGHFCLFVDTAPAARGAIRQNVDALSLFGQTRLHRRSALALGPKPAGLGLPFDLVFIDPPYRQGFIRPCLQAIREGGWIREAALIVAETGEDELLDLGGWTCLDTRISGAAKFWFLTPCEPPD